MTCFNNEIKKIIADHGELATIIIFFVASQLQYNFFTVILVFFSQKQIHKRETNNTKIKIKN